jgi:hypothetical protein
VLESPGAQPPSLTGLSRSMFATNEIGRMEECKELLGWEGHFRLHNKQTHALDEVSIIRLGSDT